MAISTGILSLNIASRVEFRDDNQRLARRSRERIGSWQFGKLGCHSKELPSWDLGAHSTRDILAVADGRFRTPVGIDGGVLAISRMPRHPTTPGSVFQTTAEAIDSHAAAVLLFRCQQLDLQCPRSSGSTRTAKMPKVHLLDYVAGNVRSLVNAIEKNGYEVEWVRSPEEVANAEVWIWIATDWRLHALEF